MFRIFVLLSVILSCFTQTINKYFFIHNCIPSIVLLMMHVDVCILLCICLLYGFTKITHSNAAKFNLKEIFHYKLFLLMLIPIGASYFKNYLLHIISPSVMAINSMIIPFIIVMLSAYF